MATLKFGSMSYTVDHACKGPNYVHGYDVHGKLIVAFDGVTSFDDFEYDDTFMQPEECLPESCNNVMILGEELVRPDGTPVGIGASIEAAIAVERGRIDELVAMRGEHGMTEYTEATTNSTYTCDTTLTSNGLSVLVTARITVTDTDSSSSVHVRLIKDIPSAFMPFIGDEAYHPRIFDMNGYGTSYVHDNGDGTYSLLFLPEAAAMFTGGRVVSAIYNLSAPRIEELADLRVDYKGSAHPTAGEAIRQQFDGLNQRVEDLESNGTGGGSNSGGTADTLVVRINADDNTASHTASQILEAYSGGHIVRASLTGYSTHLSLLSASPSYAVFIHFADDNSWEKYLVTSTGAVEYYNEYFAYDSTVGEISEALDSIIAIQGALIGGGEA